MKKYYALWESTPLIRDEVGWLAEWEFDENVDLIEFAAFFNESGRDDCIFELICYHIL